MASGVFYIPLTRPETHDFKNAQNPEIPLVVRNDPLHPRAAESRRQHRIQQSLAGLLMTRQSCQKIRNRVAVRKHPALAIIFRS